ncbi:hypothetical protein BGZ93_008988 [Podila epicladia]|nr:hypothetical protein BGZ92_002088 [Podila epicladia]KAG0091099.1 hypothetical protein BGZ93_008988 [Podila epicladia]
MTTAHRYPKSCDKAASPSQGAEMIDSFTEGNQGQGEKYSTLGDDQGGQLPGNPLDTSLPALPHGYLVPHSRFNVSQSTSLHSLLHSPLPSHLRHLCNINDNNSNNNNENNENNENTPIARVGDDTFVTYYDEDVHPVFVSQSLSQAPLPTHSLAHLVHTPHSQDFPIHGVQTLPPGHVPLVHAQALPIYGLQAPPPDHLTPTPSLALGSAAAVVTTDLSALSLASLPGLIPEALIPNLAFIDVAKRVNWHVRNAVTIGSIWLCPFIGCPHWLVRSKDAFKTHLQRRHYKTSGRLCPVQGCKIKIGYHVDLKRHIDQVHLGIGHYCSCDDKWYSRLETLKKQCSRKDKCPGAVDHRVTGAAKKGGGSVFSSKH